MNTINTAQASLSLTGASSLTMGGVIALSWSASLFLGTLENYIPNTKLGRKKSINLHIEFVMCLCYLKAT